MDMKIGGQFDTAIIPLLTIRKCWNNGKFDALKYSRTFNDGGLLFLWHIFYYWHGKEIEPLLICGETDCWHTLN